MIKNFDVIMSIVAKNLVLPTLNNLSGTYFIYEYHISVIINLTQADRWESPGENHKLLLLMSRLILQTRGSNTLFFY